MHEYRIKTTDDKHGDLIVKLEIDATKQTKKIVCHQHDQKMWEISLPKFTIDNNITITSHIDHNGSSQNTVTYKSPENNSVFYGCFFIHDKWLFVSSPLAGTLERYDITNIFNHIKCKIQNVNMTAIYDVSSFDNGNFQLYGYINGKKFIVHISIDKNGDVC